MSSVDRTPRQNSFGRTGRVAPSLMKPGDAMYDLTGKTILVTGASKGIGAAIAGKLGTSGAFVVGQYGSDREGAEKATSHLNPSRKRLIHADFNDLDSVEALWKRALEWQGRIDVLVNNAAIMLWDGGVDQPLDRWDAVWNETLRINLLAPARLIRQAIRHYLDFGGGTVITISSWAAQKGVTNPASIAYGAAKSAIHNATQTIARAYAAQGILAYIVAPGVVSTRLSNQFAETQGGKEVITESLAMKEWVSPEEVANTVEFLSSGVARHLSGATLDLNGASYIR